MENKNAYNQPPQYSVYPNVPSSGYPHPQQTGYPHHPQPGYPNPPQAGFQQPPVVMVQPQAHQFPAHVHVGPDPKQMQCPSCHATILTNIKHEPTTKTHLIALCLCCFICWPCVCLPYCMDSCQNANHYCPNCDAFIGTYEN